MKVAIVNYSDMRGGAAIVSFRLMEALRAEGVDARMLVVHKESNSPYVEQATSSSRARVPFILEHLRIFAQNGFSRKRLFQVSAASDGLPLSRHPLIAGADAVLLNWVNQGMLSLDGIKKIASKRPTFWIMHDQWNFTGICHHTGHCDRFTTHCERCPYLGCMKARHDLSYRVFNRKKELYDSCRIVFTAVSPWLKKRAGQSVLLRGRFIEMIPNAFPVEKFASAPKNSRAEFWLPDDKKLILFCAARIDDPGKGIGKAIEELNGLEGREDVMAVFAGACRNPEILESLRIPWRLLGPVEPSKMPSLMASADVVLSTSPFETLSTTMIEAQAAGATPVCFTHDGRGDIVQDGLNGYALEMPGALKKALDRPVGRQALLDAANRYSAAEIARKYIGLIKEYSQR